MKQVAALTGVSEARLRVWERRYRVVQPGRSPGGYRLYDDHQVAVLREVAALVEAGVPVSRAVQAVLAESSVFPGAPGGELPAGDALVAAAAALDPARLAGVIGGAFAAGPFEEVADEWVLPQLERLGHAWETGELSVAQEHFASAGLMRAIAAVFDEAEVSADAPVALVGLPAGDRHELALLSFATCLRRQGVNAVYLGADVPTEAWERAAQRRRARIAVIGVTADASVAVAQQVVDLLGAQRPPVAVWVGGSRRHRVNGARPLPDSVSEAAGQLRLSLAAGRV